MTLRVLVVEDNADDVELIRAHLNRQLGQGQVVLGAVRNEADMRIALREPWDVILCDYNVPGFPWPRPFIVASADAPNTAFIVLSGVFGEDLVAAVRAAFMRGVDAYLGKEHMELLSETISQAVRGLQAQQNRDDAVKQLRDMLPPRDN